LKILRRMCNMATNQLEEDAGVINSSPLSPGCRAIGFTTNWSGISEEEKIKSNKIARDEWLSHEGRFGGGLRAYLIRHGCYK
jgi:hypothetical protein